MLALCVLAFLTRAQAVALFAAVLTAPLALAWIERGRPRRLDAWKPLYGIVAAAAVLVVDRRGRARPLARRRSSAATASRRRTASYHVWPALRWILYHVAALDLSLFVLPFAALIVLVANARHLDRAAARRSAPRRSSLTVWLDARGRRLRVALVAAHRGAEPLLSSRRSS